MSIFDLFKKLEKQKPAAAGPPDWIIAGLGNPGQKYERTRHNAGYRALDLLAARHGAAVTRLRFKALTGEAVIAGKKVLFMKPQTFMNLSGESIGEAAGFYKIAPEHILILCDDVALPEGKLRIRRKGSDGGHNGLKDIVRHLHASDFPRIKIGVGSPLSPEYDMADWVLGRFTDKEWDAVDAACAIAAEAAQTVVRDGIELAMRAYN